ncbi:MAG: alpha/beta hydrolase [Ilumatobacteraceae bacterium]
MRRRVTVMCLAAAALAVPACSNDSGVRATQMRAEGGAAGSTTTAPGTTGPDTTDTPDSTSTTQPGLPDLGPIDWGNCTDETTEGNPDLECATLTVPLDYGAPDGDTVDIALVRQPAQRSRIGAVLFNPGGPGASGFEPIAYSGDYIQSELGLERFDIVGFDPRGVDRSGGLRCLDDDFLDEHLYLDDTPDTAEEIRLLEESATGFADGCEERYGDTLRFYSTANTARDMDMIRAGLGDDQISYLGISYGTYLGGVYATMFPDRVRAMVLDSAYEPNGDTVEEQYLTQLVGFEEAFDNWAEWCRTTPACPFTAGDVGARWDALRLQLDDNPVPGSDGRLGNQAVMDTATTAALYSESEWPVLADALARAEAGDSDALFALADSYEGRNPDGTFNTLFQSFPIIQCASGIEDQPIPDPQALLDQLHEKAPRFSKDITLEDLQYTGGSCDDLMDDQPVVELNYTGTAPILVVGGKNDPATPFRWAEEMAGELGPTAVLLTYTGEGHGQLLVSTCVTDAEAATLADLTLPDAGAVCDPDPAVERPAWWGDLPTPPGVSDPVSLPALMAAVGLTDTTGYGEMRLTSMSPQDAVDAYIAALTADGYRSLGSEDVSDLGDTVRAGFLSPSGDFVLVFVMGPEALALDDLASAATSVPDGQSVVLVAYLPE